jgi:hypothetical protein
MIPVAAIANMNDRELEEMGLDDLWDLHQRVMGVLDRVIKSENASSKLNSTSSAASSAARLRTWTPALSQGQAEISKSGRSVGDMVGPWQDSALDGHNDRARKKPRRIQDPTAPKMLQNGPLSRPAR